jgi:hypothetical protein
MLSQYRIRTGNIGMPALAVYCGTMHPPRILATEARGFHPPAGPSGREPLMRGALHAAGTMQPKETS